MVKKESRQLADNRVVAFTYMQSVEKAIVDLLVEAKASDLDELKVNDGHIQRHIIEPYSEMITLTQKDEVTHVGKVWLEGDEIRHVILTAEDIKKGRI